MGKLCLHFLNGWSKDLFSVDIVFEEGCVAAEEIEASHLIAVGQERFSYHPDHDEFLFRIIEQLSAWDRLNRHSMRLLYLREVIWQLGKTAGIHIHFFSQMSTNLAREGEIQIEHGHRIFTEKIFLFDKTPEVNCITQEMLFSLLMIY